MQSPSDTGRCLGAVRRNGFWPGVTRAGLTDSPTGRMWRGLLGRADRWELTGLHKKPTLGLNNRFPG
jgi:hypothetical protein